MRVLERGGQPTAHEVGGGGRRVGHASRGVGAPTGGPAATVSGSGKIPDFKIQNLNGFELNSNAFNFDRSKKYLLRPKIF
jgi:hypothetical protein